MANGLDSFLVESVRDELGEPSGRVEHRQCAIAGAGQFHGVGDDPFVEDIDGAAFKENPVGMIDLLQRLVP